MKKILLLLCFINSYQAYADNSDIELDLKLIIVSVPDYVFATATYATPVKYTIEGCDKAEIGATTFTFDYEDKSVSQNISGLFVANDGPSKANGTTATYTAIVPPAIYQSLMCEDVRTPEAQFKLTVTVTPYIAGKKYKTVTLNSDIKTGKVAKMFFDQKAYCVELPTINGVYKDYENVSTDIMSRTDVKKEGLIKYTQTKPSVSKIQPYTNVAGHYGLISNVSLGSKTKVENGEISSIVDMWDDEDDIFQDYLLRAENCGVRDGLCFFVSYGGKFVDSSVYSQPIMDLNRTSGFFDYSYCNGNASIYFGSSIQNTMDYVNKVAPWFGIASALTKGQWSLLFGTLESCYDIMAITSHNDAKDAGDALVTFGYQKHADGHSTTTIFDSVNTAGGKPMRFEDDGEPCLTGEQFTFIIQADAACTLETIAWNMPFGYARSFSKAAFYTDPSDLYSMSIHTRW